MNNDKPIYLKGLNGIRAIAALGVLTSHINIALEKFNISNISLFGFNEKGEQNGSLLAIHGVTMFFALSGFLITFLLLNEIKKKNKVAIKAFYMRRILRIWPLYFLYLILCIAFLCFFEERPAGSTIFYYVFFLANIPFIGNFAPNTIGHLWSIAVEEQFYLFWPHLCKYKHNLLKAIISLTILQIIARILLWQFYPDSLAASLSVVNRFDCMMIGGIIAYLLYNRSKYINYLNNKWVQIIAWASMFSIILNILPLRNVIVATFVSVITGIIIIGQVMNKNKIINLENKVFNFLGILSFGIYVYHPLVISLFEHSKIFNGIENETVRAVIVFASVITTTIIIANLSYHLIEVKFLKLKDRFSVIKSTNQAQ